MLPQPMEANAEDDLLLLNLSRILSFIDPVVKWRF
jgi:hypothetical protein